MRSCACRGWRCLFTKDGYMRFRKAQRHCKNIRAHVIEYAFLEKESVASSYQRFPILCLP